MDELLITDACKMPTAERPFRLAEFESLFAGSVREVDRLTHDSVRMRLAGSPGLLARVQDLTERESSCCSFFRFRIEGDDDGLTLDVAVPPSRRDILDGFAARASELSA